MRLRPGEEEDEEEDEEGEEFLINYFIMPNRFVI